MKKFILSLVAIFAFVTMNAQSFQYHQGYDFKGKASTQKFIADYFWTSPNETWNVFSWNNFDVNYDSNDPGSVSATALLYAEYQFGKTGLYLHPEVRFNTWCENYYQFGLAYRLPFENLAIYLTPKYSYHNRHDFQFSINSSYENDWFYHEGYLDTDWVPTRPLLGEKEGYKMGFWTEQKFYWKATPNFHFGVNIMLGGDTKYGFSVISPMFVARVSLY